MPWRGSGYSSPGPTSSVMQSANNGYYQASKPGVKWKGGTGTPAPQGPTSYRPGGALPSGWSGSGWGTTDVYPSAPQGGGQSFGSSGSIAGPQFNIGSQVTPKPLWSPAQTQTAINQYASDQFTNADPSGLLKQYTRPGISRDEGTLGLIAPQLGAASANTRQAMLAQPLLDALANQQNLLQGQRIQGQEGIGLANARLGQASQNQQFQQGQVSNIVRALLGFGG